MFRTLSLVTLAALLASCGGGDPAPRELARYEGAWLSDCSNYIQARYDVVAAEDATRLDVTFSLQAFQNANCTGAVIASVTSSGPYVVLRFVEYKDASVLGLPSVPPSMKLRLERVSVTTPVVQLTATGPAVTRSTDGSGRALWQVTLPNGGGGGYLADPGVIGDPTQALLIQDGKWYRLQGGSDVYRVLDSLHRP